MADNETPTKPADKPTDRPSEGQHKFEPSSPPSFPERCEYLGGDDVCGQPREASIHQALGCAAHGFKFRSDCDACSSAEPLESEGQQAAPTKSKARRITDVMLLEQLRYVPGLQIPPRCELHILEILRTGIVNARADGHDEMKQQLATRTVSDAACPHCFGERSLGDCQVTQRLHAEALAKVTSDAAEAQPSTPETFLVIDESKLETLGDMGEILVANTIDRQTAERIAAEKPSHAIYTRATGQASTGRVWDERLFAEAIRLLEFYANPDSYSACDDDQQGGVYRQYIAATCHPREPAAELLRRIRAARNLDTSEADNYSDET